LKFLSCSSCQERKIEQQTSAEEKIQKNNEWYLPTKRRLCVVKRLRIASSRADWAAMWSLREVSAVWSLFLRSSTPAASALALSASARASIASDSAFLRAFSLCSNCWASVLARSLASASFSTMEDKYSYKSRQQRRNKRTEAKRRSRSLPSALFAYSRYPTNWAPMRRRSLITGC
jgi:hypothetical protein